MGDKPQLRQNLWTLAFESLTLKDRDRLSKYHSEKEPKGIDETVLAVQEKQKTCLQKRWTLKLSSGRRIIIRDVLDKIAFWVNKFKEVGDVAARSMIRLRHRCHGVACGFCCKYP